MSWLIIIEALYIIFLILFIVKILFDIDSGPKASAYILLVILLPVIGMVIYIFFGHNHHKKKLYSKRIGFEETKREFILKDLYRFNELNRSLFEEEFPNYTAMSDMVFKDVLSPVTLRNEVILLTNGEEKFPELIADIEKARHHIHFEYYIYEDDEIGNHIADLLIKKASEGVEVRFIYDDFGSRKIRKHLVEKLRKNGVKALPFLKINFVQLANRVNYRNHRKIVVIDGKIGYVGGINISDRYDNSFSGNKTFWRDTHMKVVGEAAWFLQRVFIADWNFSSVDKLEVNRSYFQEFAFDESVKREWVQIISDGPDTPNQSILFTYLQAILQAKEEVLLATPYFIPGREMIEVIKMAALKGVVIKLIVPMVSDSYIVNKASRSNYESLLESGVEIWLYRKGFIHAKTMVCDGELSVVGTANLDHRSFDLNFEVNAIIYGSQTGSRLRNEFMKDLRDSEQLLLEDWVKRPFLNKLTERVVRLIAPLF